MTHGRRPMAIYAVTIHGAKLGSRLLESFPEAELFVGEKYFKYAEAKATPLPFPVAPALKETFDKYDCHVFITSVGAAVRLSTPYIKNKNIDPAVLCVDDAARFCVCILSGHIGRGNEWTQKVANALGATPVVTTASDVMGTISADILGREYGWRVEANDKTITRACASCVNGAPILFVQETGETGWWSNEKPLPGAIELVSSLDGVNPAGYETIMIVTDRDVSTELGASMEKTVIYRPGSLVLGLGCDKNTPPGLVERGVEKLMGQCGFSMSSVKQIATIDIKREEQAFLDLSKKYGWPISYYPAEKLDRVEGIENPSKVVKKYTGTRGVAEPAALLTAGVNKLLVPKLSYTEPGAGKSMTMALARMEFAKDEMEAQHVGK
ncbi:Cobalt-precorrin 5A hydrolase [hydrothermal vent metagenome]|uniref:Cobalt-precorrin 5A hydrolase n=1 Tax=hydrothermal vent metagenome TaxID=652676 RepID=A0A3B1BMV8_9ZZZZ